MSITTVKTRDIIKSIEFLLNKGNISSASKKLLTDKIATMLLDIKPTDDLYTELNKLKVKIRNTSIVSPDVRRANLTLDGVDEKLTLSYKQLMENTAIDSVNEDAITDANASSSIRYLKQVKAAALLNNQLTSTDKVVTNVLVPTTGITNIINNLPKG